MRDMFIEALQKKYEAEIADIRFKLTDLAGLDFSKKDKIIFIGKHEIFDNYYNLASKYSRIDFVEDGAHSILNFEDNFFSVINANNIRD